MEKANIKARSTYYQDIHAKVHGHGRPSDHIVKLSVRMSWRNSATPHPETLDENSSMLI
jgi:4-hydroxyphenylpyruvate dioxygenase-like putative hemolysin